MSEPHQISPPQNVLDYYRENQRLISRVAELELQVATLEAALADAEGEISQLIMERRKRLKYEPEQK